MLPTGDTLIVGRDNPRPSDESSRTTMYVYTVVGLAIMTLAAIVAIKLVSPTDITTGNLIIGVMGPLIAAFMAAALQGVHRSVNSRMDKFIATNDATVQGIVTAAREDGIKVGQQQGRIAADRRTDDLAQQQTAAAPAAPAVAVPMIPAPLDVKVTNIDPIPVTTEKKPK